MDGKRSSRRDSPLAAVPPFKIATIARLTSFSPERLRAWERRYELLRPKRGPGGHRLYGVEDLRVLRAVRDLLDAGRSIGEINDIGRDALLGLLPPQPVDAGLVERWMRDIVEASLRLDETAVNRLLDDAISCLSAETAIDRVILAAQRRIGTLWASGRCNVASEHMLTGIFVFRVRSLVEQTAVGAPRDAPRLLCACLPGERHELGLLTVGYSLAIRGARITMLGADVPIADLAKACEAVAPRAALLSVSSGPLYRASRAELLEFCASVAARTTVVLGGTGVPTGDPDLQGASVTALPPTGPPSEAAQTLLESLGFSGRVPDGGLP